MYGSKNLLKYFYILATSPEITKITKIIFLKIRKPFIDGDGHFMFAKWWKFTTKKKRN